MACLGCGTEVTPDRRWCAGCAALWSREAQQISVPPAIVEAPAPPPVPPTPWTSPATPSTPVQVVPPFPPYAPPMGPFLTRPSRRRRGDRVQIGAAIAVCAAVLAVAGLVAFVFVHHHATTRDATRALTTTSSTAADTSGIPLGYAPFVDHTNGFRIAVPTAWRQINPTSPGASIQFQQLVQANPRLAAVVGSGATISKEIKFFAIDPNFDGTSPNVNVAALPALGARDADLPKALASIRVGYDRLGLTILHAGYVPLAGHRALQLTVRNAGLLPNGAAPTEIQDFVAANDLLYTITFAGTSPDFHTIATTFAVS
jgi:hypothetical protein